MSDKLTMDVHRLLTMCNYYHQITKDDKDFLALLAGRLEFYDGELVEAKEKATTAWSDNLILDSQNRKLERELSEVREEIGMAQIRHSATMLYHRAQVDELTAQRDTLVEALEAVVEVARRNLSRPHPTIERFYAEALAAVKGGSND